MLKKLFNWLKNLFIDEEKIVESYNNEIKMVKTKFFKMQRQYNHKRFEFVENISGDFEIWRVYPKKNEDGTQTTGLKKLGIYDFENRKLLYKNELLDYFESKYFE